MKLRWVSPKYVKKQNNIPMTTQDPKRIAMKAFEAGFNAGVQAILKDSKNEYAYMQYKRREYIKRNNLALDKTTLTQQRTNPVTRRI